MTPSLADLHAAARARGIARYRTHSREELEALLADGRPAEEEARPTVRLDRHGPLAVLTLDDAPSRNALGGALFDALDTRLRELAEDADVRLVALTGAGRVFSAGAGIREYDAMPDGGARLTDHGTAVANRLASLPVPVVALLNGHAVGGAAELALAADWRLMTPQAELRFVHAGLGLVPGFGGLGRLARLVGPSTALHLLATRASVDGRRAVALGLALDAVPAAELVARARDLADAVAQSDRAAVAAAKRVLQAVPVVDPAVERSAFLAAWPNRRIPDQARA